MRIALHEGEQSLTVLVRDVLGRAHDLSSVTHLGQLLDGRAVSYDLTVVVWPEQPLGRSPGARYVAELPADRTLVVLPHELTADRLGVVDVGVDYLVHPFHPLELVRRVELKRGVGRRVERVLRVADLVVDEGARLVERSERPIELTRKEFDLLAHLARNRGLVQERVALLEAVWGSSAYNPNVIEVTVSGLRHKLEAHGPRLVHTVRGVGYVCREPVAAPAIGVATGRVG